MDINKYERAMQYRDSNQRGVASLTRSTTHVEEVKNVPEKMDCESDEQRQHLEAVETILKIHDELFKLANNIDLLNQRIHSKEENSDYVSDEY